MDEYEQRERRRVIYLTASRQVDAWESSGQLPKGSGPLYQLLGFRNIIIPYEHRIRICSALLGPNGLTIAKMLLARRKNK